MLSGATRFPMRSHPSEKSIPDRTPGMTRLGTAYTGFRLFLT